ncbi:hypothetical protein VB002_05195 [Campylobacter concisus]
MRKFGDLSESALQISTLPRWLVSTILPRFEASNSSLMLLNLPKL